MTDIEKRFIDDFMNYETLLKLSDIVLNAIKTNSFAITAISSCDAQEALRLENNNLEEINHKLCNYAKLLDCIDTLQEADNEL